MKRYGGDHIVYADLGFCLRAFIPAPLAQEQSHAYIPLQAQTTPRRG